MDMGLSTEPGATGAAVLSSIDVNFVPYFVGRTDVEGENMGVRIGAGELSRSVPMGENLTMRVDLVGLQAEIHHPFSDELDPKLTAIIKVALDTIGFKAAMRAKDEGLFVGANLASLNAEVGLLYRVNENLSGRVMLGAQSEFSVGGKSGPAFSFYSRSKFYGRISADILTLNEALHLSVFVEASENIVAELGVPTETELQRVSGLIVSF